MSRVSLRVPPLSVLETNLAVPLSRPRLPDGLPLLQEVPNSHHTPHSRASFRPSTSLSSHAPRFAQADPRFPPLQELYLEPYDQVPFHTLSAAISPIDLYYPHHPFFTALSYPLGALEWIVPRFFPFLRTMASKRLYEMVRMEDENTNCQTVGPVSKCFGMVVRFLEDGPE